MGVTVSKMYVFDHQIYSTSAAVRFYSAFGALGASLFFVWRKQSPPRITLYRPYSLLKGHMLQNRAEARPPTRHGWQLLRLPH